MMDASYITKTKLYHRIIMKFSSPYHQEDMSKSRINNRGKKMHRPAMNRWGSGDVKTHNWETPETNCRFREA